MVVVMVMVMGRPVAEPMPWMPMSSRGIQLVSLKWINQKPPASSSSGTQSGTQSKAKANAMPLGYQSDSSHFSMVDMPVPSGGLSDSEDIKTPEQKVASLEEQIHELRRQQALIKKDSNMDTSEGKNRKTENNQ